MLLFNKQTSNILYGIKCRKEPDQVFWLCFINLKCEIVTIDYSYVAEILVTHTYTINGIFPESWIFLFSD